jgi:pimeloyl-ACP methyl ester carboxylesterase
VPTSQARELAGLIPGSRLHLVDSGNHIAMAEEPAWPDLLGEIEAFLGEE